MPVERVNLIQSNIQRLLDRIGERELNRRADNVLAIAKATAPVSDGTYSRSNNPGKLRDSLRKSTITTTRDGRQIRIFSNATNSRGEPYAKHVIRGTAPHIIRARNVPLLRFYWIKKNRGMRIFQVSHPGTKPNNFLREALRIGFRR